MSQLLQYYRSFQQNRNPTQATLPTFEDLSIDVRLSDLQRFLKYSKSTIALQRLVHIKMLTEICTTIGFLEAKLNIFPLFPELSNDVEPAIRQHFVDQLSLVAEFCFKNTDGYEIVLFKLLPLVSKLLEDDKQEASNTLIQTAKFVKNEDLGQYILTILLRLAHEDDKEELRMTSAELLNSLADCFGTDLCKQFVIPEMVSMAEDPVFRVRKSVALNLNNVCKIGGEHEQFERLMPAFVRLSKDDMYRVRRACADSLCEISKCVGNEIRQGVLVEIFLRLIQDPSRIVKQSILQQSGMFLSTLPSQGITEALLAIYCSLANDPTGDPSVDAELKHCCAFCFPGVFQAIGVSRWKELKSVYQTLVQCRNANVKQTLAHSLHEIAKIFQDEAIAEEELVPVFEEMIQDVESIQIGVIKHLAEFLKMLSEPCRISYLPLLHDILHSTNPFNWRLRQCLAVQLPELVLLPPIENLYDSLFPLIMTLLQDPVAVVRRDSYLGITKMISILSESAKSGEESVCAKHFKLVISSINTLIHGETYQMRQLWVELCHSFLLHLEKDIIEANFLQGIVVLSADKVCNVRVSIASLFITWDDKFDVLNWQDGTVLSNWAWLFRIEDIKNCIKSLSCDDIDVYNLIKKLQVVYKDIEFKSLKMNIEFSKSTIPVEVNVIHQKSDPIDFSMLTSNNIDSLPNDILGFEAETNELEYLNIKSDNNDDEEDEEDEKYNQLKLNQSEAESNQVAKLIEGSLQMIEETVLPDKIATDNS